MGLSMFAAVAALSLTTNSKEIAVGPDDDNDDEFRRVLPRNDSEFSLGLNRSESVSNGLIQLGNPCFYSWPGATLLSDNLRSIFIGICLTIIVTQISRHDQHHRTEK